MYDVIIPAYNCAEYLGRLVRQLIEYNEIEDPKRIIIVDDCSDDDGAVRGVARYFSTRYERLRERSGPLIACKKGVELSQSDYFVYCDSDISFCDEDLEGIERYGDVANEIFRLLSRAREEVAVVMPVILKEETMNEIRKVRFRRRRRNLGEPFILDMRSVYAIGIRFSKHSGVSSPDYMNWDWGPLSKTDSMRWKAIMSAGFIYAIKRKYYDEVGGYDEAYAPGYREFHDDLMLRLRSRGLMLRSTSEGEAYHPFFKEKPEGDLTNSPEHVERSYRLFKERWEQSFLLERKSVDNETTLKVLSKRDMTVSSGFDF